MFKKREYHRRGGGILGVFRFFLSLFMMTILALGVYQAYKSFSGVDPLKISPTSILKTVASSDSAASFITSLLSVSPGGSLEKAKNLLGNNTQSTSNGNSLSLNGTVDGVKTNSPMLYRFAVMADSHKDTGSLAKALTQAKKADVKFVIGIGDLSDVGTIDELSNTKQQFDASGLNYYLIPGDHDLWDSINKKLQPNQNFKDLFGTPYQSFSYQNTRLILLDNSDDYLGLDELELKWLQDELDRLKQNPSKLTLAFVGTPLYHPSSDHSMGRLTPKLKDQAAHVASILKKAGVAEVLAGDTHFSSRYTDPSTDLKMTAVGAVTSVRNPQSPRFVLVDVFEDGSYNIQDTEIK